MELFSPPFWVAVLQIIAIDVLLSGDNAVVIALACRRLPPRERKLGIFWGVSGAIALRVALTFFAVGLLSLPYLKLLGAALLIWIGIKLILPEDGGGDGHEIAAGVTLAGAVKTIILADFVMSLDNVIGVAGAAKGSVVLLAFGLLVSIPLIVWSSQMILKFMDRHPAIITLGGALLGYVAGEMLVGDPALAGWIAARAHLLHNIAPFACAILVVLVGKGLAARAARKERPLVDLGDK